MTGKDFMDIYLPLGERMYKIAMYILESEQDAEDAVQDLYVRLWNSRETLDAVHSPEAYCITLTRNICLDRLRRKENSGRGEMTEKIAGDCDTEDSMIQKERLRKVYEAMGSLSGNQRKILKMRVFDEMSYDEIAKETGLSHLTLRVMVSQARNKIKRML